MKKVRPFGLAISLCTFRPFGLVLFLGFEFFLQKTLTGRAVPVLVFSHNL